MCEQIEYNLEDMQQQLYQVQAQQMKQDYVLQIVLEVLGSNPSLARVFERACVERLSAIAQTSPEAADELEQYFAHLLHSMSSE